MTFLGEANLHLKKKYWPPKILRILRQDQGLGSPKKHKVNTQDPSNFFITTQDQQGLASGIFKQQKVGLWFIFPALWSVPPTNFQTGFQNFPPKKTTVEAREWSHPGNHTKFPNGLGDDEDLSTWHLTELIAKTKPKAHLRPKIDDLQNSRRKLKGWPSWQVFLATKSWGKQI